PIRTRRTRPEPGRAVQHLRARPRRCDPVPRRALRMMSLQSPQNALQKQYPGLYARTVNPLPCSQTLPNAFRAFSTTGRVLSHAPVRDHDLSNMDDNAKRAGSLLIATLATLGLK